MYFLTKCIAKYGRFGVVTSCVDHEVKSYKKYYLMHRLFIHSDIHHESTQLKIPKPELDFSYLCDVKNKESIELNIKKRKGVGNIQRVHELYNELNLSNTNSVPSIASELMEEALMIPNKSHPDLIVYGDQPHILHTVNEKKKFDFQPKEFDRIVKINKWMRSDNLTVFAGHKSYCLLGDLAEMEQALIKFSVEQLMKNNFKLIGVPDILHRHIIESCGMHTKGDRTQVYELDPERHPPDMALSGTSEMALAGYLMNEKFSFEDLPIKLAAVSRCYRAETSRTSEERGIYRVHQFTKVEMFGVTNQENSEDLLNDFRKLQEENFRLLGLHFQTLDMPLPELGAPAYRKYDIEAWLPGRCIYGEVSSCSNCTDYQSRRLNIKYQLLDNKLVHVHTVNGTACAIPRMLIALLETYQQKDGSIQIPHVLQPFMGNKKVIGKQKDLPNFKVIKKKLIDSNVIQDSL